MSFDVSDSIRKLTGENEGDLFNRFIFFTRVILIGILLTCLVLYVINALRMLSFPYQIDHMEGFALYEARLLAEGRGIYHDINEYPHMFDVYTPLYLVLCSFLVRLFDVSFFYGRFLSAISAILSGVLVYLIVYKHSSSRFAAAVASLFLFASPYFLVWSGLFRVEMLGLLLSLAGIYIVDRFRASSHVYIAAPLFILALYTKQSFLAAPLASTVYLFLQNKKVGAAFGGIFLAGSGALFLVINHITGGHFYMHVIQGHSYDFNFSYALNLYPMGLSTHIFLFAAAAIYIAAPRLREEFQSCGHLCLYFILSAMIAFLGMSVRYANMNHMIEMIAVSCILTGFLIASAISGSGGSANRKQTPVEPIRKKEYISASQDEGESITLPSILIILLIAQSLIFCTFILTMGSPTGEDAVVRDEVSIYLMSVEGDILSEDMGILVLNDMDLIFQPTSMDALAEMGLLTQVKYMENGTIRAVILNFDIYNDGAVKYRSVIPEMVDAIRRNYHLSTVIGDYHIYESDYEAPAV